jgi:peptide/nickel transport system permease protein
MSTSNIAQDIARQEAPSPAAQLELGTEQRERILVASQWQLMWWKFRRHKLALVAVVIISFLYVVAAFVEFIAPYDPRLQDRTRAFQPPTKIHFVDAGGNFHLRPFVYGIRSERDPKTLSLVFEEDTTRAHYIQFFVRGVPYKLWGLFPMDRHLIGLESAEDKIMFLGADRLGQDMFSRLVYGTRISMTIGLVGVTLSLMFGILLGGVSGYYGGVADTTIQRVIEFIRSMPTIPLWMALTAALPADWPTVRIYFGITIILSLIGWTGLARVVRGRFLALREEDFVMAARLSGSREFRIILRHMVPSFLSHIIASLTLAVPRMILSETSLSFLGLGLRYPAISWGVLLQDAQNVRTVALAPWLLAPGITVVAAVLSLNFLGDGLRDAADPYAR